MLNIDIIFRGMIVALEWRLDRIIFRGGRDGG
jgi:hypothetical protein